jgi:ABC-type multidrug transport system ATPase subunit
MDEATLCDRIGLIQSGKILSIDTPEKIIESYPDALYAVKATAMFSLLKTLNAYENTIESYAYGEYAHASFSGGTDVSEVKEYLKEAGLTDVELHPVRPTIEDCFIKLLRK